MLLSFERPIVGAFAFEIPRATLLHSNGLVRAVLPESDWNMCKRTIGVPQELGRSCRFLGSIPAGDIGCRRAGLRSDASGAEDSGSGNDYYYCSFHFVSLPVSCSCTERLHSAVMQTTEPSDMDMNIRFWVAIMPSKTGVAFRSYSAVRSPDSES